MGPTAVRTRHRMLPWLFAAALVLASCGSGSSAGPDTTGSDSADTADTAAGTSAANDGDLLTEVDPSEFSEASQQAAAAAIDAFGSEGAFVAVMLAFERGYDADQISGAAVAGELSADGTIATSGTAVEPTGQPAGVLELTTTAANEDNSPVATPAGFRAPAASDVELNPLQLYEELPGEDTGLRGLAVLTAIISLSKSGYDLDQIVQELILGGALTLVHDSGCAQLGGLGALIRPARIDTACAGEMDALADELEELDRQGEQQTTTSVAIPDPASDSAVTEPTQGTPPADAVEVRRFEGQGGLVGDDPEAQSQVFTDEVFFDVGETLSGVVELYANVEMMDEFFCIYLLYEFEDVPMSAEDTFTGSGTGEVAAPDQSCTGSTPPPVEVSGEVTLDATVDGNILTLTLTTSPDEEPLVVTAIAIDP